MFGERERAAAARGRKTCGEADAAAAARAHSEFSRARKWPPLGCNDITRATVFVIVQLSVVAVLLLLLLLLRSITRAMTRTTRTLTAWPLLLVLLPLLRPCVLVQGHSHYAGPDDVLFPDDTRFVVLRASTSIIYDCVYLVLSSQSSLLLGALGIYVPTVFRARGLRGWKFFGGSHRERLCLSPVRARECNLFTL